MRKSVSSILVAAVLVSIFVFAGVRPAQGKAVGPPQVAWKDLTYDQKRAYMKDAVVPTMKPIFQAFDAKKYANFGCKTCHGKDPQKTKYKMPNRELPQLDFHLLEQGKQKPNIAEWMSKTVKPQVAQILEVPQMSKDHPDGFGCLECHTEKK